jgi:hypothetical protein
MSQASINEYFATIENPKEGLQIRELHYSLDRLDEYLGILTVMPQAPNVALNLAEGRYRVDDDLAPIAARGEVETAAISSRHKPRLWSGATPERSCTSSGVAYPGL